MGRELGSDKRAPPMRVARPNHGEPQAWRMAIGGRLVSTGESSADREWTPSAASAVRAWRSGLFGHDLRSMMRMVPLAGLLI